MDEARLSRMVEPLPLYRPAEAASRIDQAGGPRVLFSPAAETTITYWSKIHQAVRVMRELSKTVLVLLRAYRQGQLSNSHAVLRILPVLAMSCFVPGSEDATSRPSRYPKRLHRGCCGPDQEVPCGTLCGDVAVLATDQRIQADPVWSGWVQAFVGEGRDLCGSSQPVTHWEFPDTQIAERNSSSICSWLFRRS
jgi:hypothetical protein